MSQCCWDFYTFLLSLNPDFFFLYFFSTSFLQLRRLYYISSKDPQALLLAFVITLKIKIKETCLHISFSVSFFAISSTKCNMEKTSSVGSYSNGADGWKGIWKEKVSPVVSNPWISLGTHSSTSILPVSESLYNCWNAISYSRCKRALWKVKSLGAAAWG